MSKLFLKKNNNHTFGEQIPILLMLVPFTFFFLLQLFRLSHPLHWGLHHMTCLAPCNLLELIISSAFFWMTKFLQS